MMDNNTQLIYSSAQGQRELVDSILHIFIHILRVDLLTKKKKKSLDETQIYLGDVSIGVNKLILIKY